MMLLRDSVQFCALVSNWPRPNFCMTGTVWDLVDCLYVIVNTAIFLIRLILISWWFSAWLWLALWGKKTSRVNFLLILQMSLRFVKDIQASGCSKNVIGRLRINFFCVIRIGLYLKLSTVFLTYMGKVYECFEKWQYGLESHHDNLS